MATIASPREPSPNPSRITSPTIQSTGGGTPTSSVRTSLDLQSTTTGSTSNLSTPTTVTATPSNYQRRNRAALRDYYNLKSRPTPGASSGGPLSPGAGAGRRLSTDSVSTVSSSNATLVTTNKNTSSSSSILPPQLDDPSFDADKYVHDLLRTSTLRDILLAEKTLVSEVRTLDGERKALVYDNYSKLIKAVGTIGDMQRGMRRQQQQQASNGDLGSIGTGHNFGNIGRAGTTTAAATGIDGVKSLEGKLDKLMNVVLDIQKGVVDGKEKAATEQRKSLRDRRKKQELVKWVLDAPERLRQTLDDGHREEAEQDWDKVKELLEKWKGVAGVDEVKQACGKVMQSADAAGKDDDDDPENESESADG